MRLLLVNKYYRVRGGADRLYFELTRLLEAHGHTVIPFAMADPENEPTPYADYFVDQMEWDQAAQAPLPKKIEFGVRRLYDMTARQRLSRLIRETAPDLVHLHNLQYQLSPAILHTLREFNLPVVMHLHDWRLFCPNGYMYNPTLRQICEACRGHRYYNAVRYRCLRGSRAGSALAAAATGFFHALRLWQQVDYFIAPSAFLRQKMLDYHLTSPDRILGLPNFVNAANYAPTNAPGDYVLFYGYLVEQKGVGMLLKALQAMPEVPVCIAGDGPLMATVQKFAEQRPQVRYLGFLSGEALHAAIRRAAFVVIPSLWYENSPMTIYESYALGRPVLAARMGGIPELVEVEKTGRLYQPEDVADLIAQLREMWNQREHLPAWGRAGRRKLEAEFNPDHFYIKLMHLYGLARARHTSDL